MVVFRVCIVFFSCSSLVSSDGSPATYPHTEQNRPRPPNGPAERNISVMSQTPPTRLTNYVIFVISTARFNIYLMTVVVRVWLGIYDIEIYQRKSMCYLVVACVFFSFFCLSFFCGQSFVAA